jgi:hypothetical protein
MKAKQFLVLSCVLLLVGLSAWFGFKTDRAQQSPAVHTSDEIVSAGSMTSFREAVLSATPEVSPNSMAQAPTSANRERAYQLAATDPAAAMAEAETIGDVATRKNTLQDILALWLRKDRLAVADWMTAKRGKPEYDFLSAQVSDAFFPDDTEMSAMFAFDLSDGSLRDARVNKLVAYWKSGAHLKFDNSPWEIDPPGTGPAATQSATGVTQ